MGKSEPPYNASVSGWAVAEVLAMTVQPLVQLAGEQGDAIDASVVAEPVAGDAHLVAPSG